jgi:hemerythrin-like metal-binding protein
LPSRRANVARPRGLEVLSLAADKVFRTKLTSTQTSALVSKGRLGYSPGELSQAAPLEYAATPPAITDLSRAAAQIRRLAVPFLAWNDSFATKIEAIDDQHKGLFDLVNRLFDSMQEGVGNQAIRHVLAELIRYTMFHCAAEEAAMEACSYPALNKHRQEHEKLTARYSTLSSSTASTKQRSACHYWIFWEVGEPGISSIPITAFRDSSSVTATA